MPDQSGASPFQDFPQFYQQDNRRLRGFNPVSKAFLDARYAVLLPPTALAGKRVLDLGSGLGAAGQWALFHGADYYCGVEYQTDYVVLSRHLLTHWGPQAEVVQRDLRSYLRQHQQANFDIILLAGVLYDFVDPQEIIQLVCAMQPTSIVVESAYPPGIREARMPLNAAITEYITEQSVNLADQPASLYGVSATPSFEALKTLFALHNYQTDDEPMAFPQTPELVLYDQQLLGDSHLELRFAARFERATNSQSLRSLEQNLLRGEGDKKSWQDDPIAKARTKEFQARARALGVDIAEGSWVFDDTVAARFDEIARKEIPDYLRVIDKCVEVVKRSQSADARILDIGSATGHTLQVFYEVGYRNLVGVDSSAAMLAQSFDQAELIHSTAFPAEAGPYDVILANWVLHFIPEREAYLAAMASSLADHGVMVITEKVTSSQLAHDLYHDFKRSSGLSEAAIAEKQKKIAGVLTPRSSQWYIAQFEKLGFSQVDIINANHVFVTFLLQR